MRPPTLPLLFFLDSLFHKVRAELQLCARICLLSSKCLLAGRVQSRSARLVGNIKIARDHRSDGSQVLLYTIPSEYLRCLNAPVV